MIISINEAKDLLLKGKNVAVPTETVYGLAGAISIESAIENIYLLKGRPKKNPLIVHISNQDQLGELVDSVCSETKLLMKAFWPGPLTFILNAKKSVSPIITGGLTTIGIRMPSHPGLLQLIEAIGPIAAPSANLSGKPSSTLPSHIEKDFGNHFPIMEGLVPSIGVESTIIGYLDGVWKILRLGAVTKESIEKILEKKVILGSEAICPGSMFKHYSPNAKLFSKKEEIVLAEAIIGYHNRSYPLDLPRFDLGGDEDPTTIMKNLFRVLRSIDEQEISSAFVDLDLPEGDGFMAIKERLTRAVEG